MVSLHGKDGGDDAVLPPLFGARLPDLMHPSGLRVWFTEPLGVVTQLSTPVTADMAMARFLTEEMDPALHALVVRPEEGLYFVHDWRNLLGYSTEARKHLTDWGLRLRSEIRALEVVLGDHTPTITRMGVNVAFSALRMAGIAVHLAEDIDGVIRRRGLRAR